MIIGIYWIVAKYGAPKLFNYWAILALYVCTLSASFTIFSLALAY